MKFGKFLRDKWLQICIYIVIYVFILLFLCAFKAESSLIIVIEVLLAVLFITELLMEYFKKARFYNDAVSKLEQLDKKYLISEMLETPSFYEGEILCDVIYESDKSMHEEINRYKREVEDFKDYLEMWIHEVKLPIASLILLNHNEKKDSKKYESQIKRLDNYVDQILYYVRSENAEKDFVISETALAKVIGAVAMKNKDDLLGNQIDFQVEVGSLTVDTDAKWLEFIINQILANAIKYKKEKDCRVTIQAVEEKDRIKLLIEDNGIGISSGDLKRVFEKTFTGENGRTRTKSTGMGLYIAKKLCEKLGHTIEIESEKGVYTRVIIGFSKNLHYKDVL